jgi:hypothetical protein
VDRCRRLSLLLLAGVFLPACDLEESANSYPDPSPTASPLAATPAAWESLTVEAIGDGIPPRFVLVGDLDVDGRKDLLLGRSTGNPAQAGVLSVYRGAVDGTFPALPDAVVALPAGTTAGVLGDFDSDDIPDLLSASVDGLGGGELSLWVGQGNGLFDPPILMLAGLEIQSLSPGDFDGDDDVDLIAVRASAIDRIENVSGAFAVAATFVGGGVVACGEFRADPGDELAWAASATPGVVEIRTDLLGTAPLAQTLVLPAGMSAAQIVAADADGDGDLDLLVAAQGGGAGALVLYLRGASGFGSAVPLLEGDPAFLAARLDHDGDGIADLALHRAASLALAFGAPGPSYSSGGEVATTSFTHLLEGPIQGGRGTLLAAALNEVFLLRRPP